MKTISIEYPGKDAKAIAIQPVSRHRLAALERHMVTLQSYWTEDSYSTADTIARPEAWAEMEAIAELLPLHDNPAAPWGKDGLAHISNDYEQMERLFFGVQPKRDRMGQFNLQDFEGSLIYELHRYNPKKKLLDAVQLQEERSLTESLPQKTSRSKAAAA